MVRSPSLPKSLTSCEPFPETPPIEAQDFDNQLAIFIVRAEAAHRDCEEDLQTIVELLENE